MKKLFCLLLLLSILGCNRVTSRPDSGSVAHAAETPKWTKVEVPFRVYRHETRGYGYVSAEGFWQSTSASKGKQLVWPLAVNISCYLAAKICREADASVQFGVLKSDLLEYGISSWTQAGIVADDTDEGLCGIGHRLAIDFKTNSVTVTDYPKKTNSNNPNCKVVQDANSYTLQGGHLVLYPPPAWDALAKPEGKR